MCTAYSLVSNAEECSRCIAAGDVEGVGRCLNKYWAQKKVMAPQSEPYFITQMMNSVRPLCYGVSLCGAGGGGFMLCITKTTHAVDLIRQRLKDDGFLSEDVQVHSASIDYTGLQIVVS